MGSSGSDASNIARFSLRTNDDESGRDACHEWARDLGATYGSKGSSLEARAAMAVHEAEVAIAQAAEAQAAVQALQATDKEGLVLVATEGAEE